MFHKLKSAQRGFTLVEILIVVALIAILAVIALITINPAEAQKKARDARRIKELGTLQGIVEQYLSDNSSFAGGTAESTANAGSNNCSSGWLSAAGSMDVCNYANTVPVDPLNRTAEYAQSDGTLVSGDVYYQILIDDSLRYRICTHLESAANQKKLEEDGVDNDWFEVFSSTSASACGS